MKRPIITYCLCDPVTRMDDGIVDICVILCGVMIYMCMCVCLGIFVVSSIYFETSDLKLSINASNKEE